MPTIADLKTLVRAAQGAEPLDLIISNIRILNVYTGREERGALGIKAGRIVSLNADGLPASQVFDASGRWALPGFIDSHVHIDSTLLTPAALAELIVPAGTTCLLADPMEISNVAGLAGLEALMEMAQGVPYSLLLEVSSRVPTAPGLETTGGQLGLEDVKRILSWDSAVSLGELDPSKVLGLSDEYLAKLLAARGQRKISNGHAAGLTGRELEAYTCAGLADDHECVDYPEALSRLRLGLSVLVREGSAERNLEPILRGALADGMDTRHFMFCTDDKHPTDIHAEGHIDAMVRKAIRLGVPALQAVQMATLNPAQHFRMEEDYGSLTPGRFADVLLLDDLDQVAISDVFVKGLWVAHAGKLRQALPSAPAPQVTLDTVHLTRGRQPEDYVMHAAGEKAHVRVIRLIPDQIINREEDAWLDVLDGAVQADPRQDALKLAVVERYGKNGNIGVSFVRGFKLQRGALASSVSHDHHNIVVVGTNDADMAACVRAVESARGGLAVAAGGELLGTLPLPIAGLMSGRSAAETEAELAKLTAAAHSLGCDMPSPFMSLSFISLPTVPELGLTDLGLVSVRQHALISPLL